MYLLGHGAVQHEIVVCPGVQQGVQDAQQADGVGEQQHLQAGFGVSNWRHRTHTCITTAGFRLGAREQTWQHVRLHGSRSWQQLLPCLVASLRRPCVQQADQHLCTGRGQAHAMC